MYRLIAVLSACSLGLWVWLGTVDTNSVNLELALTNWGMLVMLLLSFGFGFVRADDEELRQYAVFYLTLACAWFLNVLVADVNPSRGVAASTAVLIISVLGAIARALFFHREGGGSMRLVRRKDGKRVWIVTEGRSAFEIFQWVRSISKK